jgi:hypothetical protein
MKTRRGGKDDADLPQPQLTSQGIAALPGPFNLSAFNGPAPPPGEKTQLQTDAEKAGLIGKGRRTRRRHRSRRRGGNSELKTRKNGMVKALLKEARNQKERSEVMARVHKQGMEMLARKAALRAKYSS